MISTPKHKNSVPNVNEYSDSESEKSCDTEQLNDFNGSSVLIETELQKKGNPSVVDKNKKTSVKARVQIKPKITPNHRRNDIIEHRRNHNIEFVLKEGLNLQYIEKQTDNLCLIAVKNNGLALFWVENKTNEICYEAVKQNGLAIKYICNPSILICEEAIKNNIKALLYLVDQNDSICKFAINHDYKSLQYIREQTDELCLLAINKNYKALEFVKYQTDKMCLDIIKCNNKCDDNCTKHNIKAFEFVKEKTEDICIAVVEKDGLYLKDIEKNKQTRKICEAATRSIKNKELAKDYILISLEPYYKISSSTEDDCPICLDSNEYNLYTLNNCKHSFHISCLELLKDNKCPLCRTLMY